LVTASNELVKNISSVRFFNTKNNRPENTYFYKKGKILDFVLIPELKLFVLSLTNKKIIVVNYQERPKFHKTIEINIEAIARKMIYKDNSLYFSTDKGEIYKYNFRDYKKTRLYNSKELITDFLIDKERLIISTINGKLQSVNLNTFSSSNLTFNDNFINVLVFYNHEKLICGTWTGKIFIVDLNSFSVKNEFSFHKRSILCIKKIDNQEVYSSSLDKTLKKWQLH
jgi:outer membrane protein assembly factor BamB